MQTWAQMYLHIPYMRRYQKLNNNGNAQVVSLTIPILHIHYVFFVLKTTGIYLNWKQILH